jgi:hypothetical protein
MRQLQAGRVSGRAKGVLHGQTAGMSATHLVVPNGMGATDRTGAVMQGWFSGAYCVYDAVLNEHSMKYKYI